jgi:hypothetical protein
MNVDSKLRKEVYEGRRDGVKAGRMVNISVWR